MPAGMNEPWRIRLASAIEERGTTMRAVSVAAGLNPGYVHSILYGGREPTLDRLLAVCQALGVSLSFLIYGSNTSPAAEEVLGLLEQYPEARDAVLAVLKARKGA